MTRRNRIAVAWAFLLVAAACGDGGMGQSGIILTDNMPGSATEGSGSWNDSPSSSTENPPSSSDRPITSGDPYPGGGPSAYQLCTLFCSKVEGLSCVEPSPQYDCVSVCISEFSEFGEAVSTYCGYELMAVLQNCDFICDEYDDFDIDFESCPSEETAFVNCLGYEEIEGSGGGGHGGSGGSPQVGGTGGGTMPLCSPPDCVGCQDDCETCLCFTDNNEEACSDSCW